VGSAIGYFSNERLRDLQSGTRVRIREYRKLLVLLDESKVWV